MREGQKPVASEIAAATGRGAGGASPAVSAEIAPPTAATAAAVVVATTAASAASPATAAVTATTVATTATTATTTGRLASLVLLHALAHGGGDILLRRGLSLATSSYIVGHFFSVVRTLLEQRLWAVSTLSYTVLCMKFIEFGEPRSQFPPIFWGSVNISIEIY